MDTTYHVDWNAGGYRPCRDPHNCEEEFHSPDPTECVREYERTMLPSFQAGGYDTLPPPWTKVRRPPWR